ncbi:conserved hypothetical protein [Mesorhizobium escarrei]|uniref:Uncharacterized protein n=2 Tax=Mesorhizobium escarrei TaxID=666018 RepID=A0ABM9E3F2_9HYPH|nr:conserved hypothetical protein [Mesorhizobium escarrei]
MAAMLVASAGQYWPEDSLPYKPITEEALRTASARLYSDILRQQCMQGRRYSQSQIENGFKRHFEETRLTIVEEGYTIVPNTTEDNSLWTLSELGFDVQRRFDLPSQFGCFRAYWLDGTPNW